MAGDSCQGDGPHIRLIHVVPSDRWGGMQRYALDICAHFKEEGWQVEALTRDARAVDKPLGDVGVQLHHAPLRGFFDLSALFTLRRVFRRCRAMRTVVHVHRYRDALAVLLAKRLAGRPDIRVAATRHKVKPGGDTWLLRRIYRKLQAHIFVSKAAFDTFARTWGGVLPMPAERVHILHNSLRNAGESLPLPEKGPLTALCLGALAGGKGIEDAIDAMASLSDLKLRLRIAGSGTPDYLDSLRTRAARRGVTNAIDWNINPADTRAVIAKSHFGVSPSLEREAFGMPNLMMMAAGRPQVCTSGGAQEEYLDNGVTALFVPPGNPPALAGAMRAMAADPALRTAMGSAARKKYETALGWDRFTEALRKIYTDI